MVPVDEQGASSNTASNGPPCHSNASTATISAPRERRARFLAQPVKPRRGAIDRSNICTGERELCSFAAGCCAQVGNVHSLHVSEKVCGQRGGGVLHPPGAFGKSWQQRNRAVCERAYSACGQHATAQPLGPGFRVPLNCEIKCRLVAIGGCNRARSGGAIGLAPALEQPFRRVTRNVIGRHRYAVLRHTTKYSVDETGVARSTAIGLRQPHRQIDGGVIGNFEPEYLCCAKQHDRFGARRVGGKSFFKKSANQMAEVAKPPQYCGREPSRQGAVPVSERGQARMRVFA